MWVIYWPLYLLNTWEQSKWWNYCCDVNVIIKLLVIKTCILGTFDVKNGFYPAYWKEISDMQKDLICNILGTSDLILFCLAKQLSSFPSFLLLYLCPSVFRLFLCRAFLQPSLYLEIHQNITYLFSTTMPWLPINVSISVSLFPILQLKFPNNKITLFFFCL